MRCQIRRTLRPQWQRPIPNACSRNCSRSPTPCVEIVRVATVHDADLIVMGIDAPPTSPAEFGETTSCVMRFAATLLILVTHGSSSEREVLAC